MSGPGEGGTEPTVDARVVRTRNDILRTALQVLVEQGWDAVTHAHLAEQAGYSRATVYKHWATRTDLLRDALARVGDVPHHTPTGDLRADLIAELTVFRLAIEAERLDRAMAVLVALTAAAPELIDVRDTLVTNGERVLRALLRPVAGDLLEAAMLMLSGSVLYAAQMHGRPPTDDVIASTVDMTLRGLAASGTS